MPVVQTICNANIRPGLPGVIVDGVPKTLVSRTVEVTGGLAFGIPVMQGIADKAGRAPITDDTAAKLVDINVCDRPVRAEADQYSQYESVRAMTEGAIQVAAVMQVVADDPVYFASVVSTWTNVVTGNVQVAGARFDTSTTGTNQLAQVRLG